MQHCNKWNRPMSKLLCFSSSRHNNLTALTTSTVHTKTIISTRSTTATATASSTVATTTSNNIPCDYSDRNPHKTSNCAIPSQCIQPTSSHASPSPSHVHHHHHHHHRDDDTTIPTTTTTTKNSALVYPNFLSPCQASALESDVLQRMKRKRLERGHWDAVISNYKEVELVDLPFTLSSLSVQAIERVRDHLVQTHFTCPHRRSSRSSSGRLDGCRRRRHGDGRGEEEEEEKEHGHDGDDGATLVTWLNCHAIYLSKHGMLSAHVDSVKFSGDIVAGLSLKSACIMRLKPVVSTTTTSSSSDEGSGKEENLMQVTRGEIGGERGEKEGFVDLYLPPRSLYVLSGVYRYSYTHEILPSGSSFQFGSSSSSSINGETIQVDRDDRLSIIFRDAL